ncbi:uncharacterized protein Dvir_GJ18448, isoform B [Drosophila virilis]|uniref:Uncharacterized protein, isoform B n=1 Tax=Drosophila virilis TaxID=7244 RepID=A0A0Q9W0Y5_DROVI|nr:PDZ and LIM domain protein Zasp isoform X2 [Drosophila virilis]KRF78486.1 uncharacterized protein Dvir_GJ18448, isoform B [Drosophila virilis]
MAQPQLLQIKLSRFDAQPWGFRLQGGVDFAQPLLVQKVNSGSLSEQAGLQPGDAVIKINDVDVFNFRHKDAQDIVVRSGNNFVITVQRGGSTWRPHVTPTGNLPQANSPYLQTVTKTSLAHHQPDSQHIGCGYNNSARPFANGGGDGGVKSIVNKQYNTPVGIYSDESIAETLSAQAEVLAGGVLGVNFKKNEKEYQADRSEVLKFLREEETGGSTPAFNNNNNNYEHDAPQHQQQHHQQQQQQYQQQQQHQHQHYPQQQQQSNATRHVNAPVNSPKPPSTGGLPTGQNICTECERLITGVFVRIKDKNLHVECFKCATCGTSLKNQGYYNFNNKLYCDIHAKLAAQQHPPAGTEGYVPVPIKPNTKLSANTISSALSSHGYGSNGYSNGNATPTPAPSEPMPEPDCSISSSSELPLPPPPSPTQLLQYEAEELLLLPQNQQHQHPTQGSANPLAAQPHPNPDPQQQQQQQQASKHTRSLSSISSGSSQTSSSGVGGCAQLSPSLVASSASTLSLDMEHSPQHSRQASGSCTSLDVGSVVQCPVDNYTMSMPSPPPPPPPAPALTPLRSTQNENDMNTQNKSHNAYNQLLKQYANKLQQQHPNSNNTNTTATATETTTNRHNNTAKPFAGTTTTATATTGQLQPHVAALTATLANQLKFNSHQATTTAAAAAPTANSNPAQSEIMSAHVADEQSAAIYSSYNNNNINNNNMGDSAACTGPCMQTSANGSDQPFEYVTLTGNVIRSVQPPGKGAGASYRVNQGYARPYGASQPPAAAPKSPVPVSSYPPQQQQQSPRPAGNPYATLPRSNVGQQELEEEGLQPQFEEECYEVDVEVALAASRRSHGSSFSWPPPQDEGHAAPTAAPLYIAPPETQHVVVANPVQEVPPLPPGSATSRLDPQPQVQQKSQQAQQLQPAQAPQWQSYSAPQLTNQLVQQAQLEQESSSDSYTSTSTTTTNTSEEYQRMYAAQLQAYQMQQAFEHSGSELDYQLYYGSAQDVQESASGRRSAQECVDSLSAPLSTYKLIDMVREVTPSPVPAAATAPAPAGRHVAFNDEPEIKELPQLHTELETIPESATEAEQAAAVTAWVDDDGQADDREGLIIDHRCQILESERMFQPTPEINFEIAPVRQRPAPSKIPNPMPKEWINPMIRVLTTAPEVPFHLVECPFPKPCDDDFEAAAAAAAAADAAEQTAVVVPPAPSTVAASLPTAPSDSYGSEILRESPPRGTRFSQAMATAPEFPVRFAPPATEGVPLPEETVPYMPPPMDMKPYLREDYRPKSPFVSALTTAPERPFEGHFDRDVPIHLIDLPTPKEHLTMGDALCTAPDRGYTPLNPENATQRIDEEQKQQELKKYEFQVLDHEEELGIQPQPPESVEYYRTEPQQQRKSSAFAAMQAFQPSREPLSSSNPNTVTNTPRASIASLSKEQTDLEYQKYCKAQQRNQKRLDYYHKKEEELQSQQHSHNQTQMIHQLKQQQHQQQQQHIETNSSNLNSNSNSNSLVTASNATASSNSSSTVQQSTNSTSTSTSTANSNSKSAYVAKVETHAQVQASSRSTFSATTASNLTAVNTAYSKFDAHELIEETADELEHSEVLFPPPSPLSHLKGKAVQSGLHKADTIPKYQRNWTVLPTQSPIRTPEPQELRDNVPLAFVDAPKAQAPSTETVHRPIAKVSTGGTTGPAPTAARGSIASQGKPMVQPSVPIIIEDRSGPVTMAFQSLDEYERPDQSLTPTRPYTPSSVSSMINKPAPIIPFYQTTEKLCFDECPATHARDYDQGAASPFPDRARSPAPGPPPNPLSAIRAPRMKEPDSTLLPVAAGPRLQAGSITTGQSYQGQLLAHSELSTQSGSQSYSQQPETLTERKIGNLSVQQREQSSLLQQQQQSQLQSQTKTQIGNTQIERRRKVTEEFERTQSAKTIEIRTGSHSQSQAPSQVQLQSQSQVQSQAQSESTERRQSYGRTGYVANQARRLSGLEQEISSLTSQSQAISARASTLGESTFPQLRSPTFEDRFPLKPTAAEAMTPNYAAGLVAANKLLGPPPGFKQQQQQQSAFKSTSASVSNSQQQLRSHANSSSLASASAITSASTSSSASASRSAQASLTKASAITTTTNNQACAAYRGAAAAAATGSSLSAALAKLPNKNASNAAQTAPKPTIAAAAAPPAPASFPPNICDLNSNVDGSTGAGGKSGAFGATSAPKRGRGILNKAAGPGVRIPLCNSCNVQIRGPFITALGRIWCPDHFICVNGNCRRPLQDIGFVEEKGDLYCEYCFEKYLAPTCSKCAGKIKGDCLNAIGKHFHPECFTCGQCGKIFGNTPFFLEDGNAYCEADWNELFTTKCFACGFPVEAGDRWVEALNHNYHSQCFNCTFCKQNLEGQSFYNKGGRPFCKNHAR